VNVINARAIVQKYGGEESGIVIWFVNQVAESIEDEFPDKYIGTLAYRHTPGPHLKVSGPVIM
jgi:hypothetical protein